MNPRRFTIFSAGGVSGSTNSNMCPGFLCHLWSDQFEFMVLFMVLKVWIGPGFTFESCT
jgi:hypothetical protein